LNSSCGNNNTEFISLDLHRTIINKENNTHNRKNDDEPLGDKLYEYTLVKNPPTNPDSMKKIFINYFHSIIKTNLDKKFANRQMTFYKYSRATKPFITSTREYAGFARIYLDDQYDDYLGSLILKEWEHDSLHRIETFEIRYIKDTIINEVIPIKAI